MKFYLTIFFFSIHIILFGQSKIEDIKNLNKYFNKLNNYEKLNEKDNLRTLTSDQVDLYSTVANTLGYDSLQSVEFYKRTLLKLKSEKMGYNYYLLYASLALYSSNGKEDIKNFQIYYNFLINSLEYDSKMPKKMSDIFISILARDFGYIFSAENGFENSDEFNFFTESLLKIIDKKIDNFTEKEKLKESELLHYKAEIEYKLFFLNKKQTTKLSSILSTLTNSITLNQNNFDALETRSKIKFYDLEDFNGAIIDYLSLYNLNKKLKRDKYSTVKNYYNLINIGECYMKLKKLDLAIANFNNSIKDIDILLGNKKEAKLVNLMQDKSYIYYQKALCYHLKNDKINSCKELRKAIDYGYSIDEISQSLKDFNCN